MWMKPRKLTMRAFGPYLTQTVIDFAKLYSNGLFLISGATGCGKSTILDAISYALYGRAAGSLRDVRDMRTIGASDADETRVSFEMEKSGAIYKFERAMRVRTVRRRTGEKEKAIDYEENCYILDDGMWKLICSGTQMKNKAKEILGFSQEQFSQIVVLPQGEFRRLLTAPSTEKQKILETLFGTARWQSLSKALAQKAKSISDELTRCTENTLTLCKSADCENAEQLNEMLETAKCRLVDLDGKLEKLSKSYDEKAAALREAESIERKFCELDNINEKLEKFHNMTDEFSAKKQKLMLAQKAESMMPYYKTLSEAETTLRSSETRFKAAQKLLEDARLEVKKVEKQAESCMTKEETLKKTTADILRFENAVKQAEIFDNTSSELKRKEMMVKNAEEKTKQSGEKVKQLEAEIERIKSEISTNNERFVSRLAALVEENKELEAGIELLKRFETQKNNLKSLERQLEQKRREFSNLRQNLRNEKKVLEKMQEIFDCQSAYRLSQELVEGERCPVCGSTSHPFPAIPVAGAPTKEKFDAQKSIIEDLEKRIEASTDDGSHIRGEYDSLTSIVKELADKCKQFCYSMPEASKRLEANSKELLLARKAEKREKELKNAQKAAEDELARVRNEQESLKKAAADASMAASGLKGRLAQIDATIPIEMRDAEKVRQTLENLKKYYDELSNELKSIRENRETVKSTLSAAEAGKKAAETALEMARNAYTKALEEFEKKLTDFKLPHDANLDALSLPDEKMIVLKDEIETFEREGNLWKDKLASLKPELDGKKRPDIEKIRENEQKAREENAQAMSQKGAIETKLKNLENINKKLKENALLEEKLRYEFSLYERLSSLLNGSNPLKTPIHQFVLSLMLDDILACANMHLSVLSKGRYALMRTSLPSRGNGTKGLELSVVDAWGGGERSVSTLSGGEMFLASLSLAFGLSDVVQSYSGGIRLDSLFIDEGFGSLDEETLETAMAVLERLRLSGRLIGIISHVGELRDRIKAHIDVIRQQDGTSTVKVSAE